MKLTNQKLSGVIHGVAYLLLIISLLLMNLDVLTGQHSFIFINISLSLIVMMLCGVVLLMRKGSDDTPLYGVLIGLYSIIIVMGAL